MNAATGVCLIVLDGWGLAPAGPGNAVSLARTPTFDHLWRRYPHTELTACGRAVGLPDGQMGNSEVGHLNLGAGAIVRQDLTRIDDAIADGTLQRSAVLRAAFAAGPGRVHLIGLVSDGGVHSSLEHLEALIGLGGEDKSVIVHALTDGRDTLPMSGERFVARIERIARVGSVMGRFWAMDRDSRWDRVQRAYDLLVHGRGAFAADSGEGAVRAAYARGETDEFIEPTLVGGAESRILPGDSVVCFNFRPDRMREIVRAVADPACDAIDRGGAPPLQRLTTLTEYHENWPYPVAFLPERPRVTLSQVIAQSGARQLHVAETEKYPHVTYFFNGGEEEALPGERRELVPSPRDVATYDERPAMSAREAAAAFCAGWREDSPRFGVINFANADMVGHTGVIPAAVEAVETVDACLREVVDVVLASAGECIVTADHGNSDHMLEPDGSPNTAHSLNPVPLIVTRVGVRLAEGGVLADVAPTVLSMLGLEQPSAMSGRSLIA